MTREKTNWHRVTRANHCPICDHPDWCCVSEVVALCMRTESDQPVESGGWIHRLDSTVSHEFERLPVQVSYKRTDDEMDRIWRPRAERWRYDGRSEIGRLALVLGVSVISLRGMGVGWDGKAWTFPERNGAGLIVGVSRRFEDGSKRCAKGSHRGLTYFIGWKRGVGPVLVVEGGSDVAAGLTLGLAVVGRPSNVGGLKMLTELLRGYDRKIVVLGERDKKPDGRWPGMDGCKSIASGLAKRLRRGVVGRLLPDGAKDLRSWLNSRGINIGSTAEVENARDKLLGQIG